VLTPAEAVDHPHNRARDTFLELRGVPQPAPAPRFSRTALDPPAPAQHPGESTDAALASFGFDAADVEKLRAADVLI
jgi:alpha-methylacyl-CoA racemase